MDRIKKINELDFLIEDYKVEPIRLKDLYIECNTFDLDFSLKLYRVLSYDRLLNSLRNKYLSMTNPSIWPDPYETFLLNHKVRNKDGTIFKFGEIRDKIYCQCWSKNQESEALWNVHSYSCGFQAVKIKSSAKKLMEYLYDINNKFHYLSYFIGSVSYVSEDFIDELLQENISKFFFQRKPEEIFIILSLFIKRKAFEYEDEVRLVFNSPKNLNEDYSKVVNPWNDKDKYFSFKIDINDVIEEITFHPKLKDIECIEMEREIRSLGYSGEINRSNLLRKKDIILNF